MRRLDKGKYEDEFIKKLMEAYIAYYNIPNTSVLAEVDIIELIDEIIREYQQWYKLNKEYNNKIKIRFPYRFYFLEENELP